MVKVRFVQKKNRMMKDGSYPIYLSVCAFGKRVEKATSVSCLERHWNSKEECIRKSCTNYVVLNSILNDIKQRIIKRKLDLEYNQRVYTASMLVSDSIISFDGKSNVYKSIMDEMISARRLAHKTKLRHMNCYRKLCSYIGHPDFLIDELDVAFLKDFMSFLTVGDSGKRDICACISAVWNYAISHKIVDGSLYPFTEFKYSQLYKDSNRDYTVNSLNMRKLRDYFLDLVIIKNGKRWTYRDGSLDRLHKRTSKEFGLCYFLAMYYYNGSAPTDVARLRVDDVERVRIDGEDYFKLEFKRQKTKRGVSVRLKRNMFSIILLEHFLGFSKGGYVYPVISENAESEAQIQKSIEKCGSYAIKWVREAFSEINARTIESNVINGEDEELVDVSKVVLYTARHSLANNYLSSPNANVRGLASLMARSANTIQTYIHSLQNDKEIAEAVSFLNDD